MNKRATSSILLVLTLVAGLSSYLIASTNQDLEVGLIDSMRLNKSTKTRLGDSGKAIQAYMREGLVNKKPNQRADYTDYYLLKKPARLMGHDLVMIEEEYMSAFIGCCVNQGIGVTVKVIGSTKNLEEFANENGCTFSDNVDLQNQLDSVNIKTKISPGHYASLSCRESDANQ